MLAVEHFKPYSRGITKQQIIRYLEQSDQQPTNRTNSTKRALQMEAVTRQRRKQLVSCRPSTMCCLYLRCTIIPLDLDTVLLRSHPAVAHHPTRLGQQTFTPPRFAETSVLHETQQQAGISPLLLQPVDHHGFPVPENAPSPGSDRTSSHQDSSLSPFEHQNSAPSADQIEFSDDEE